MLVARIERENAQQQGSNSPEAQGANTGSFYQVGRSKIVDSEAKVVIAEYIREAVNDSIWALSQEVLAFAQETSRKIPDYLYVTSTSESEMKMKSTSFV